MSSKKILTMLLSIVLAIIYIVPISADVIPIKKIQEVEEILYGSYEDDAIIDKINKLESLLLGHKSKGSLIERSWEVINYVDSKDEGFSLLLLVNAMEWSLFHEHRQGALLPRIEEIEKNIFSSRQEGPLIERIEYLSSLLLSKDSIEVEKITLNTGQEINIRLLDGISSNSNKKGDIIAFELESNLKVDDYLLIPSGTRGSIKLTEVKNAESFGKDASLGISINDINAIDGKTVPLTLVADEEDSYSTEVAVGVSFLSTIIVSNPVGLVAGYFYKGKDIELPEGTVMQIQVRENVKLRGLRF